MNKNKLLTNVKPRWTFLLKDGSAYSEMVSDLAGVSNKIYNVNGTTFYILDEGIASSNDKSRVIRLSGGVDGGIAESFQERIVRYTNKKTIFEIDDREVYYKIEDEIARLADSGELRDGQIEYSLRYGGTATLDYKTHIILSKGVDKDLEDKLRRIVVQLSQVGSKVEAISA